MTVSQRLRRLLAPRRRCGPSPFADLRGNFDRARDAVRVFYLLSTLFAASQLMPIHFEARHAADLDWTWPVMWLQGRDLLLWTDLFLVAAVVAALVACINPRIWLARAVLPAALLLLGGLTSSFGGINHYFHSWFWVALVLAFLPAGETRPAKLGYCMTFATAQAILLGFYTLAGMFKLREGMMALAVGGEGDFAPRGLALTLADRIVQTGTDPLLGRFLVDHYWLSWPMFVAVIYIQLTALFVTFRPRLHMAWGLALLAFHLMTFLAMEIIFVVNCMLILALLVRSPFQERAWCRVSSLEQLPLLGRLFSQLFAWWPSWRPGGRGGLAPAE